MTFTGPRVCVHRWQNRPGLPHAVGVEREKKIDVLRRLMAAKDWHRALRLAAAFPRLGEHADAIRQGWAAASNPGFYRQIRKDPEALVAAGIRALCERYSSAS